MCHLYTKIAQFKQLGHFPLIWLHHWILLLIQIFICTLKYFKWFMIHQKFLVTNLSNSHSFHDSNQFWLHKLYICKINLKLTAFTRKEVVITPSYQYMCIYINLYKQNTKKLKFCTVNYMYKISFRIFNYNVTWLTAYCI